MATKNFTQFSTATPLTTGDYIVGYKEDGSEELKATVKQIVDLVQDSDNQTLNYNDGNLSISSGNSVTLSSFDAVNAQTRLLSAGTDLFDIFLTSETDSQTLSFDENTKDLAISSGNTVSLSALVDSSIDTGVRGLTGNWEDTYNTVQTNSASWEESADITAITTTVAFNSGNWNTAYETATVYQTNSATYATNTLLDSVSSQLVPKTDFDSYKTDVAATTATLITNTLGDSRYNPKTIIGTITTPFSQTNTNALDDLLETAVSLEANKTYLVFGTVATTNSPTGLANGCKIMLFSNNTSDDSHTICQIVVHGAINGSGGSVRVSTNFSGSLFNTPHVTPTGAANAEISNSFQGIIRPSINCDMRVRIAPNNVADEALVTKAGSSLVVIPIDF